MRLLSVVLAVVILHLALLARATESPEYGEIKAYFEQQERQAQMGSMIILPVLGQEPATRAALLNHQLQFTSAQAETIFWDANIADKSAFLPLIRREAVAPSYSPDALALLSEFSPTEARPLVIADIQEAHAHHAREQDYFYRYPDCYLHLPDQPIPELTSYFHGELSKANQLGLDDLDALVELIDRYGTPELLPEVLRFYRPNAGKWACIIEKACLGFWIRCDRKTGLAALDISRRSRKTGCYRSLLADVSEGRWDADMHQRALEDLHGTDPEMVASSIYLLARRVEANDAGDIANAYLKLTREAATDPVVAKVVAQVWTNPGSGARILLEERRLHFTVQQVGDLKAIASKYP